MGFAVTYIDGLGQSLGDTYVTADPFYSTGQVWYVYSGTGVDAADPNGRNPAKPFATLGYAISASATYDTIVLMDGHAETITAAKVPLAGQTIVGGGSSGGLPTVKLTMNAAAAGMLTMSAANVQIRNVWFNANAQANSVAMMTGDGFGVVIKDCYFQMAQYDDAAAISIGGDYFRIEGTTFVSTATVLTAQPYMALEVTGGQDITLSDVTFDGGTTGFSQGHAAYIDPGGSAFLMENITLLRGADILVNGDSPPELTVSGVSASGGGMIRWESAP